MKILISGAAGFLGTRLTRALLERGNAAGPSGTDAPIRELVLADRAAMDLESLPNRHRPGIRVRSVAADVSEPASLDALLREGFDSVFALAATLTVESESDFARGMSVNLHGLLGLLEGCRRQGNAPRFVFTSSLAAFGGPLPETVDDSLQLTPQTSYGTQKAIGELLVNDYTRHGFLDGRCLRLPIVMTRHAGIDAPAAAAHATPSTVSGAIAAIVGDRLLGRDVLCPLAPTTRIAAASAARVVDALIAVHDLPAAAFGHTRSMNLPALSLTLEELADATARVAARLGIGAGAIDWAPDSRFQAAVDQWPRRFVSARASDLGIRSDRSADEIVEAYLKDNPRALAAG
jgi:nucleoside-diphosphate-sugar epimerase